eukprot:gene7057-7619_t
MLFFLALIVIFYAVEVHGNDCASSCDVKYTGGMQITMCGIDKVTYSTTFDALDHDSCYLTCGVATFYEGVCGCPNNCHSELKQGSCSSGQCLCENGWGGEDCSLPIKGNSCGYHGKLITTDDKDSEFPFAYCECDSGFTGTDCSSEKLDIEDEYGDNHPLFNIERLSTIRIEMKEEDFITLLTPDHLYDNTYYPASFYWDNGKNRQTFTQIGIKLKGQGSRESQKKGFSIKFNEYISGQRIYDMKKIGLKPGYEPDDTFLKNILYNNMIRAIGGPVQRSSYALLYINQRFYGLMIMVEDYDDEFITRRLQDDDGQGNLIKLCYNVHLGYFGDNITYYQERSHTTKTGGNIYYYDAQSDNTDLLWDEFVKLLTYFNTTTSTKDFEESINDVINIQQLIRHLVVENFLLAEDHFQSGNNYFLYQQHNKDKKNQWIVFYTDFDSLFQFHYNNTINSDEPNQDSNILSFYNTDINEYDDYNPLLDQLFQSNQYIQQYIDNYGIFMHKVFGSDSKQQPNDRFNRLFGFVANWVKRDRMWQLSNGKTYDEFVLLADQTMEHLTWRYQDVMNQLNSFTSTH